MCSVLSFYNFFFLFIQKEWSPREWLQFSTLRTGGICSYPNDWRVRRNNKIQIYSKHCGTIGADCVADFTLCCNHWKQCSSPNNVHPYAFKLYIQKYIGHPIYAVYYSRLKKNMCTGWKKFRIFREGKERKRKLALNTNCILSQQPAIKEVLLSLPEVMGSYRHWEHFAPMHERTTFSAPSWDLDWLSFPASWRQAIILLWKFREAISIQNLITIHNLQIQSFWISNMRPNLPY